MEKYYIDYACISLIIFCLFTYLFWVSDPEQASKLSAYISVLSLLLFAISGIIGVQTYRIQLNDRKRSMQIQAINLLQNRSNQIDKLFMSTPSLDRLYCQMNYDDPMLKKIMPDVNTNDISLCTKEEHQASNIIFQCMADIYITSNLEKNMNKESHQHWIHTFQKWLNSRILRYNWQSMRNEFPSDFVRFIENELIQY